MVNVVKTAPLINNSNPLPDGSVQSPYTIATVAAAGTTQATATQLAAPFNLISNNTAANGVILPVASGIRQTITVYPQLATNAPKVYPPVGGTINSGTVNVSVASTAQKAVDYIAIDTTGLNFVTSGL